MVSGRAVPGRCLRGVVLLWFPLLAGCVGMRVDSDINLEGDIPPVVATQDGETVLVYGEEVVPPQNDFGPYGSGPCKSMIASGTIERLLEYAAKANPASERRPIRRLEEARAAAGLPAPFARRGPGSPGISSETAREHRFRYAIHVRESFDNDVILPLYAVPAGMARCQQRTTLDVTAHDLQADAVIGRYTVSASGSFTMMGWMYHVMIVANTQSDAAAALAKDIVERFTGQVPQPFEK